jgi:hypothetical protein
MSVQLPSSVGSPLPSPAPSTLGAASSASSTSTSTSSSTATNPYRQELDTLELDDTAELLQGSFSAANPLGQPGLAFGSAALISATTQNTINVLEQAVALQKSQTPAIGQTVDTTA